MPNHGLVYLFPEEKIHKEKKKKRGTPNARIIKKRGTPNALRGTPNARIIKKRGTPNARIIGNICKRIFLLLHADKFVINCKHQKTELFNIHFDAMETGMTVHFYVSQQVERELF